jgi:pullulanase
VVAADTTDTSFLIVHYHAKENKNWDVWAWADGNDGQAYQFTGTDAFGQYVVIPFKGQVEKAGVIIRNDTWVKDGDKDREIPIKHGRGEVWINGGSEENLFTAPTGQEATFTNAKVNVHYFNKQGYSDAKVQATTPSATTAEFTGTDDFGKVANLDLTNQEAFTDVKFTVTPNGQTYSVHPIPGATATDVWIAAGDKEVYYNPYFTAVFRSIKVASIDTMTSVTVNLTSAATLAAIKSTTDLENVAIDKITTTDAKNSVKQFVIHVKHPLDLSRSLTLRTLDLTKKVTIGAAIRTAAFDKEYAYGGQLGALYQKAATTFKVWAPTATQVKLVTYKTNDAKAPVAKTLQMKKEVKGVWSIKLTGNQAGLAYTYQLAFTDGKVNTSVDPYAKAATLNGDRSVVEDVAKITPKNFKRMEPFTSPVDAVIYEAHVRDFSINSNSGIKDKGKFLGLIQAGTKTPSGQATGIDYLKQLGITHVELLPIFDYASVDESSTAPQYNWGYDPKNYDVPEGSYATNAKDPTNRILELKQTIKGMHDKGLRVIMDVVYNHVSSAADSPFEKTVPGYYFRYNSDGSMANGSGCGNDTASERVMMRKYILDSVKYWATNYHLDGFRFDLMGNIDVETMREVRAELNKIDKSIIVIGEGWDLDTPLPSSEKSTQDNAAKLPGIAFFNDTFRDAVKGSVFDGPAGAFVSGLGNTFDLGKAILGNDKSSNYLAPTQSVNYVEAHDNLTLFDKLSQTNPTDTPAVREQRDTLATSFVLFSQGIPFMQAGQEFLRTKGGNDNSYNAPDSVNAIDWNRITQQKQAVNFVKAGLKLRASEPLFRLTSAAAVAKHMKVTAQQNNVIAYELSDPARGVHYVAVFNGTSKALNYTATNMTGYKAIFSNTDLPSSNTVKSLQMVIYKKTTKPIKAKKTTKYSKGNLLFEILPAVAVLIIGTVIWQIKKH